MLFCRFNVFHELNLFCRLDVFGSLNYTHQFAVAKQMGGLKFFTLLDGTAEFSLLGGWGSPTGQKFTHPSPPPGKAPLPPVDSPHQGSFPPLTTFFML